MITVTIDKAMDTVSTHASQIAGSYAVMHDHTHTLLGVGDVAVLMVQAPRWLIIEAGSSTSDPSEDNTISLTLAANVELRKGAAITLTGLTGFKRPSQTDGKLHSRHDGLPQTRQFEL